MLMGLQAYAQQTFPENGVKDEQDGHYTLTNANIYVSPNQKLEKASLRIKKGKIVEVGVNITVPDDAVKLDMTGKTIYPSFIDLNTDYGMPTASAVGKAPKKKPQMLSNKKGAYHWNEALRSETRSDELFKVDDKKAKDWREVGFGTVLTYPMDGIARGASTLVLLGNERAHEMILKPQAAAHYAFHKGKSTQAYPGSLMGMIALLRQTYYDAQWYAKNKAEEGYNISLERWNALQNLPQIFTASGLNVFRADKLGDEMGVQYIFAGDTYQYRRMKAVKQTGAAFIVPINFPLPYDVSDPYEAQQLKLSDMKHWELAPTNPAALAKAGLVFTLTTYKLKKKADFLKNLRIAYQHGLSEKDVLSALTTTPARLLKISDKLGTLEKGKLANFIVTSGNILSEKAVIYHNWIKGKPYVIKPIPQVDIRATYELKIGKNRYKLEVKGSEDKPSMHLIAPKRNRSKEKKTSTSTAIKFTLKNGTISFAFVPKKDSTKKVQDTYRLSGRVRNGKWSGRATDPNGNWINWTAKRVDTFETKPLPLPKQVDTKTLGKVFYPFVGYGYTREAKPKAETVLIQNATVWTGEEEGNLAETDVLIKEGKIVKIAKDLKAEEGATVVEASTKHLTAGIIDEHAHICISYGVNEATQESSAEVRIGDVINSEDINVYRQLAGGVTMAQLLHGSANPIGGQSAIVKFRWGKLPEQMKFEQAKGFIKFALGENVKQSNWGAQYSIRFPQTRMGVEQVYENYFTRAREYGEARKKLGDRLRRDLDLEAVLEILNKERFITCHSYVQSEITMLMRVAERYNFRLNTFTHILEGYKIAGKLKKHGAGASTFSDWWAYKYEVMDAIPYNAKILDDMGIVVAINSDNPEMGRRLNQEAAKGVKYGGMTDEAAWNMVSLNPAKLLQIDNYVGSIKVGKQADLVLWSAHPLSVYARAEKTFVDGICYYDWKEDQLKRLDIQKERARLVQKMLGLKEAGKPTQPVVHSHNIHYHCGNTGLNQVDFLQGLDK